MILKPSVISTDFTLYQCLCTSTHFGTSLIETQGIRKGVINVKYCVKFQKNSLSIHPLHIDLCGLDKIPLIHALYSIGIL